MFTFVGRFSDSIWQRIADDKKPKPKRKQRRFKRLALATLLATIINISIKITANTEK